MPHAGVEMPKLRVAEGPGRDEEEQMEVDAVIGHPEVPGPVVVELEHVRSVQRRSLVANLIYQTPRHACECHPCFEARPRVPVSSDSARPADLRLAADWWRQAVVYQVYPRSFADSNGDGIGDLPGITSRVPYLAELGVDAVWLSPFYPSALADGGYDVDDYRDVDPRLGTLDRLRRARRRAARRRASSWSSTSSRTTPPTGTPGSRRRWRPRRVRAARERYVFRDGTGPDGATPPSDWVSSFGGPPGRGSATASGTCTSSRAEQPDLNWDNREVRDDFLETLRFWSDRGVDGFRIDVAHILAKDLREPLPAQAVLDRGHLPSTASTRSRTGTRCTRSTPSGAQLFNAYDPPRTAVAEAWVRRLAAHRRTPAPTASDRRSTSTCSRPTSTPASSAT